MCVLSTKFQFSSIILRSFRELEEQGGEGGVGVGGLNLQTDEPQKTRSRLGLKIMIVKMLMVHNLCLS